MVFSKEDFKESYCLYALGSLEVLHSSSGETYSYCEDRMVGEVTTLSEEKDFPTKIPRGNTMTQAHVKASMTFLTNTLRTSARLLSNQSVYLGKYSLNNTPVTHKVKYEIVEIHQKFTLLE